MYLLTAGQQDIVSGTYGAEFINRNSIVASVHSEKALSSDLVRSTMASMRLRHPALRMAATDLSGGSDCKQVELAEGEGIYVYLDRSETQNAVSDSVQHIAEMFDVERAITWGVVHRALQSGDEIIFVFNHFIADYVSIGIFIRSFIRIIQGGAGLAKDTYIEFLQELEAIWTSSETGSRQYWPERPWAKSVASIPDPILDASNPELTWASAVSLEELPNPLTERKVLFATNQAVRDVLGVEAVRLDSASHGRTMRSARTAGGWLSHAIPHVLSSADDSEVANSHAQSENWLPSFRYVRSRPDLGGEKQRGAHAFVNFFGSFDPTKWSTPGFALSQNQYSARSVRPKSLTPIRAQIRRHPGGWLFSWTLSAGFDRVHEQVPARIVELLKTSHPALATTGS